jgi:hypothetical protein
MFFCLSKDNYRGKRLKRAYVCKWLVHNVNKDTRHPSYKVLREKHQSFVKVKVLNIPALTCNKSPLLISFDSPINYFDFWDIKELNNKLRKECIVFGQSEALPALG